MAEIVSLLEGASLELAGAERRLTLAIQASRDFHAEFSRKSVSGDLLSPDLTRALTTEHFCLEIEADAALRRRDECLRGLRELQTLEGSRDGK
jgi:hypothetical protein